MTGADEIREKLGERGIAWALKPGGAAIELELLASADPAAARELLYKALNSLEPHFTVFLKGLPGCFMPDAWGHALYPKKPGVRYERFAACRTCALAGVCPGLEKQGRFSGAARRLLSPVLPVPSEVVIELTKKCNLSCRLCFASDSDETRPLSALRPVLKQAKKLGINNLRFTGGEPFLSPSLLPLLKEAKELGFYTLVNTNAALPAHGLFKKAAPFIDNVLVSMQTTGPAGEKAVTGADFSVKLANMRLLREKVKVFRLGTVASKSLIRDFKDFYALAARLKADIWEIYRPMPDGRKARRAPGFIIGPADIKRLSSLIAALEPGGPRALIANPVPLCLVPEGERKNLLGAAFDDGHTRLVLDPRGFFKPSYYIEANLGKDLARAWRSPALKKINSPARLTPACLACDYLLKCLGGSRAAAKKARGSYTSPDPWMPDRLKNT